MHREHHRAAHAPVGLDRLLGTEMPIGPGRSYWPISIIVRSNGPSLSPIVRIPGKSRCPLSNRPDGARPRTLASPELRPVVEDEMRPEACRAGVGHKREISERAGLPPVELDNLRRGNAPPFEVRSDSERRNEGESRSLSATIVA